MLVLLRKVIYCVCGHTHALSRPNLLSPKINWEVELDCGTAKGTISYPDFGYDGMKAAAV